MPASTFASQHRHNPRDSAHEPGRDMDRDDAEEQRRRRRNGDAKDKNALIGHGVDGSGWEGRPHFCDHEPSDCPDPDHPSPSTTLYTRPRTEAMMSGRTKQYAHTPFRTVSIHPASLKSRR